MIYKDKEGFKNKTRTNAMLLFLWDAKGWDIRLGHIRFVIAGLFPALAGGKGRGRWPAGVL